MFPKPILVAEDDSNDVFILRRYFHQCGVRNPLHMVSDGDDVVKYFEGNRLKYPLPALLMLNLKMPRMDGLEVLEYLRRTAQTDSPTVVLTGSQDKRMVEQATQLGAESVLIKPIEKRTFCQLMGRVRGIEMKGCDLEEGLESSASATLPGAGM